LVASALAIASLFCVLAGMQNIEPSFQWESIYVAARDKKSPFFGRHYSETTYENDIYGYYIHPLWDDIGLSLIHI
jgi:hypothetical protein